MADEAVLFTPISVQKHFREGGNTHIAIVGILIQENPARNVTETIVVKAEPVPLYFYLHGIVLPLEFTLPNTSVPITRDNTAEERFPASLLPETSENNASTRVWFRIDNVPPNNGPFFDKSMEVNLFTEIEMSLCEVAAHYCLDARKLCKEQFHPIAMPISSGVASAFTGYELLFRAVPHFELCKTYKLTSAACAFFFSQFGTLRGNRRLAKFADIAKHFSPDRTFQSISPEQHFGVAVLDLVSTTNVRGVYFPPGKDDSFEMLLDQKPDVTSADLKRAQTAQLRNLCKHYGPIHILIVQIPLSTVTKSPNDNFNNYADRAAALQSFWMDDGNPRWLEGVLADPTIVNRVSPHTLVVPQFITRAAPMSDKQLRQIAYTGVFFANKASAPLALCLFDLLNSEIDDIYSRIRRITEFFVTKTLLKYHFDVLPYPRSRADYLAQTKADLDFVEAQKIFQGGNVASAAQGVYFKNETHEIVNADFNSFYASIFCENQICITKKRSWFKQEIQRIDVELANLQDGIVGNTTPTRVPGKPNSLSEIMGNLLPPMANTIASLLHRRRLEHVLPQEKTSLKRLLNALYGAFARSDMRYYVPYLSPLVARFGRLYISRLRCDLDALFVKTDPTHESVILMSITDSVAARLHTGGVAAQGATNAETQLALAKKIKGTLEGRGYKYVKIMDVKFWDSIWVKNKQAYAWSENGFAVSIDSLRGLAPRFKNLKESTKQVVLDALRRVLRRDSLEQYFDWLHQMLDGPDSGEIERETLFTTLLHDYPATGLYRAWGNDTEVQARLQTLRDKFKATVAIASMRPPSSGASTLLKLKQSNPANSTPPETDSAGSQPWYAPHQLDKQLGFDFL